MANDGWLPIESAPKDGEQWLLLLYGKMVIPGFWRPDRPCDDQGAGWIGIPYPEYESQFLRAPDAWQPLPGPRAERDNLLEALAEAEKALTYIRDYTSHGPTGERADEALAKIRSVKENAVPEGLRVTGEVRVSNTPPVLTSPMTEHKESTNGE